METTDGSAAFGSMPDFTASACGTGTSAPEGTAGLCGAASCSGTGGYPVHARNCGYVQYDQGEHVGRIARTGSREEWDLAAAGCTGAWRGLDHKKEWGGAASRR